MKSSSSSKTSKSSVAPAEAEGTSETPVKAVKAKAPAANAPAKEKEAPVKKEPAKRAPKAKPTATEGEVTAPAPAAKDPKVKIPRASANRSADYVPMAAQVLSKAPEPAPVVESTGDLLPLYASEEEIRLEAYFLYQERLRNGSEGDAGSDWLNAMLRKQGE